ncbi:Homeobox protein HD-10 [Dictyocoela muelleri]|nr:Homeobox protein HD-10 [Dictyocoela muelleri]
MEQEKYFNEFQQSKDGCVDGGYYNPFVVKHRKRTSKLQLKVLEKTFETTVKPDANLRKALGEQLGMTPRAVQVWFQNRRAKVKKMCRGGTKTRSLKNVNFSDIPGTKFPNAQENSLFNVNEHNICNNLQYSNMNHPQMLRREDIIENMQIPTDNDIMFTPITPQNFQRKPSEGRPISPLERGYYKLPDNEFPNFEYKLPTVNNLDTSWIGFNGGYGDEDYNYGNYGFYNQ